MAAKVRIKAGPVEFEYEGDTALTLADIKELFAQVETLFAVPALKDGLDAHSDNQVDEAGESKRQGRQAQKLHINSVAEKLGVKTGPELVIAAAAALQIFEQKETVSRSDISKTMRKATKYFKESMAKNLTGALSGLVGKKLNQIGDGYYSLTADEFNRLEKEFA
ncbi:MAG: hypothetical protein ABJN35_11135 [Erythrobacter sp.]